MPVRVTDVDRRFYDRYLVDFLPSRMVDVHAHIWLKSHFGQARGESRSATWPSRVAKENPIEDLFRTYELMFPRQQVTPLVFGSPRDDVILGKTNGYVSEVMRKHGLPGLIVSTPEWSSEELVARAGGFLGLKPYLSFAPVGIPSDDITIFDFLPHHHLSVANAHRWIVMLHIPRRARLRDGINLQQILEIERRYPDIQLIIAHIGRAYCAQDVGDAFRTLQHTEKMVFDFSANTNPQVMEQLIRAVGPRRILFGSDLPILRMRMRRVCERGSYVNLVPPGIYGDIQDDPHMREVSHEEGQRLTFFMYEELAAFRRAVDATGLSALDLQDIFRGNAERLIAASRRRCESVSEGSARAAAAMP